MENFPPLLIDVVRSAKAIGETLKSIVKENLGRPDTASTLDMLLMQIAVSHGFMFWG